MNLLKEYTQNQLRNCGKVGMYRFGEVLHLSPENAKQIVENEENDILYLTKEQMKQHDVTYLMFKRSEIKNDKDALPYSARFEWVHGEECITIQEIYRDTVKCKIISNKNHIRKIRQTNMINSNMTDDEFLKANADVLDEVKFVKGYYNKSEEILDKHGQHVSSIDDYDNYQYYIYTSEKHMYQIYNQEKQQRNKHNKMKSTLKYLERKMENYQNELKEYPLSKIKRVIKNKKEFVEIIEEYDWTQTEQLIRDMKIFASKNQISLKRAWKVWKYLMLPKLQDKINELENELGEYETNKIQINMEVKERKPYIKVNDNLKFHYLTGKVREE